MVRLKGFEPIRVFHSLAPQASASAVPPQPLIEFEYYRLIIPL